VADTSWEAFKKVNVDCAENVFEACAKNNVPVLFISTVDAIGMVKGLIKPDTELNPISNYGKSKALAESRLK
jgi:nucleoside-diphosphate-sugar epimerase